MKELHKEYIKTGLKRIEKQLNREKELSKLTVIINYDNLTYCIQDLIAIICSKTEEEYDKKWELIDEWLFSPLEKQKVIDSVSKVIYDFNNIDDFVDYLLKPIE